MRGKYGNEGDVASWAKLARELDFDIRADAIEHRLLRGAGRGKRAQVAEDADAADGAAAAPAADMGMRNVVA